MITVGVFHSFNQTLERATGDDCALIDFHEPSSKLKRYMYLARAQGIISILQVHLSGLMAKSYDAGGIPKFSMGFQVLHIFSSYRKFHVDELVTCFFGFSHRINVCNFVSKHYFASDIQRGKRRNGAAGRPDRFVAPVSTKSFPIRIQICPKSPGFPL